MSQEEHTGDVHRLYDQHAIPISKGCDPFSVDRTATAIEDGLDEAV